MLYRDPRWRDEPEPSGSPDYGRLALIALAALALVGLAAVALLRTGQRPHVLSPTEFAASTSASAARDLDVSFGAYTADPGAQDLTAGALPVTVTNRGDRPVRASVQIQAAAGGLPIANDVVLVMNLAARDSFTQNVFTATPAALSRSLLHATFSVAAVSPL